MSDREVRNLRRDQRDANLVSPPPAQGQGRQTRATAQTGVGAPATGTTAGTAATAGTPAPAAATTAAPAAATGTTGNAGAPAAAAPAATGTPAPAPANRGPATATAPGYTLASLHFAVEQLLNWPLNGPLMEALRRDGTACFMDLLSFTEQDLLTLQCSVPVYDAQGNDTGTTQLGTLPRPYCGSLRALAGFAYYRQHVLKNPITPINCMQIDRATFERYRCSASFFVFNNSTQPQPLLNRSTHYTPAKSSQRGIKIDPAAYIPLKTDSDWDSFNRSLHATARVHNLGNVPDPQYVPASADEMDLFQRQQAFMYYVFVDNLQTNTGKQLVRKYQSTYDAQQIYVELLEHFTTSAAAATDASDLMTWITTKKLVRSDWPGKHYAFILHWLEQVRLHNEIAPDPLPDSQLRILLENALRPTPYLREIRNTSQILSSQTGKALSYADYVAICKSAAQTHDKAMEAQALTSGSRRAMYHDVYDQDSSSNLDTIDTPTFDLDVNMHAIEAYQASQTRKPRPYLDNASWQQLDDASRRAWSNLPLHARSVILNAKQGKPPTPPPPPPPRHVNLHNISAADFLAQTQGASMGSDETGTDKIK